MVRLDTTDKKARKQLKILDIGLGAEGIIKVLWQISNNGQGTGICIKHLVSLTALNSSCQELQSSCRVGELSVLKFRRDCMACLTNISGKKKEKKKGPIEMCKKNMLDRLLQLIQQFCILKNLRLKLFPRCFVGYNY